MTGAVRRVIGRWTVALEPVARPAGTRWLAYAEHESGALVPPGGKVCDTSHDAAMARFERLVELVT